MRRVVKRFLFLARQEPVLAAERAALYVLGRVIRHQTQQSCTDRTELPALVWCDPDRITHNVVLPETVFSTIRHSEPLIGCCGGEWDRFTEDLRDGILSTSLRERFQDGKDWEETEMYRTTLSAIESGQTFWNGCESAADLQNRCHSIDRLYHDMRTNGYQPQPTETRFGDHYLPDELRVGIGRDGSIIRIGGGRHRLLLAQLLDIEKVPILITLVHEQWELLRVHGNVNQALESTVHLSREDHPLLYKY